jgi:hypothetical protein
MMTWEEHLAWCKSRALAHVDRGDLEEAVLSMATDIQTHPENSIHQATLEALVTAATFEWHRDGVRRWVEGFR